MLFITWAEVGDLLREPRLVLYAPGDVGPGPVLLALWDVVPAKGADHRAGVSGVGLGAVAGDARAGHQLALLTIGDVEA